MAGISEQLSAFAKTKTYPLTEFQYNHLHDAANGESVAFCIMEAAPTATPEERAAADDEFRQMDELVALDLITNLSGLEKFAAQIALSYAQHGYGYRVYGLTSAAITLFHGHEGVN